METFTVHVGRAAALPQPNLDTDTIIRVERMMALARDALGPWCFEVLRYRPDGSPNPDFVLNQPAFENTSIIVGGANFGCGSSREAAVWALRAFGIRCIIAPSFGDIFFNNCFQNAILPIALDPDRVAALQASAAHGIDLEIDLEAQAIRGAGREIPFDVDALKQRSLLLGLDDIDLTLTMTDVLAEFERTDQRRRPWIYADPAQATMKDTK